MTIGTIDKIDRTIDRQLDEAMRNTQEKRYMQGKEKTSTQRETSTRPLHLFHYLEQKGKTGVTENTKHAVRHTCKHRSNTLNTIHKNANQITRTQIQRRILYAWHSCM